MRSHLYRDEVLGVFDLGVVAGNVSVGFLAPLLDTVVELTACCLA